MGGIVSSVQKGVSDILGITPPKPVTAPAVPQAIEPPSGTQDTQQAQDQARRRRSKGIVQQNVVTGDLIPDPAKRKKKTFLG